MNMVFPLGNIKKLTHPLCRGEDIISQTVRAEGGPDNIPTEDCEVTFQRQSRHLFDVVTSVIVPGFSVVEPLEA